MPVTLGVHVRPLDDSPTPGSPRGSELLFGVGGGAKLLVSKSRDTALIVGPELFGATAFVSFLGPGGTALEGMLSARLEGTREDEPQLRLKLGVGAGIDPRFGAPEWRSAVAIELFDHHADRDRDGISNGNDACPDTPGIRPRIRGPMVVRPTAMATASPITMMRAQTSRGRRLRTSEPMVARDSVRTSPETACLWRSFRVSRGHAWLRALSLPGNTFVHLQLRWAQFVCM